MHEPLSQRLAHILKEAPPAGGVTVAMCEDSAAAAVRADQDGQNTVARRIARWVYYQSAATAKQKADMAELVAINLGSDTAQIIEWARNGLNYATGSARTRLENMIRSVGGTP